LGVGIDPLVKSRHMIFSPLTVQDLDEVLDIERRSFPEPWSRGMFLHEIKLPFSKSIVVRAADAPHALLGYICWWLIGDELQILNLAVHPERRQHGIGRTLVELALREAEEQRVGTVTLEVRRDNAAGLALYRAFGFEETGLRRNYYGHHEDAIIMSRTRQQPGASPGG
jgi:ribosomal-protein-alanine N-acetyltransferase